MKQVLDLLRGNAEYCREEAKKNLSLIESFKERQSEAYEIMAKNLAEADACEAAANELETHAKFKEYRQ